MGQAHIPIWVVAAWPSPKSLSRALRFDGLLPNFLGSDGKVRMDPPTPQEVSQLSAYIQASLDPPRPFDLVVEGQTPGDRPKKARAQVQPFIDAGATWWIEALWNVTDDQVVQRRIQQGPPRLQS